MASPKLADYLPSLITLAAVAAGVYYVGRFTAAGQKAIKPATDALFNAYQAIFPPDHVEYTRAGFYLNSKYIDSSMAISPSWRAAIEKAHQGNAALFTKITDGVGRLKPAYYGLINAEVNEETTA